MKTLKLQHRKNVRIFLCAGTIAVVASLVVVPAAQAGYESPVVCSPAKIWTHGSTSTLQNHSHNYAGSVSSRYGLNTYVYSASNSASYVSVPNSGDGIYCY